MSMYQPGPWEDYQQPAQQGTQEIFIPADPMLIERERRDARRDAVGIADTGADNARADRQLGNSEANEGFDRLAKLRDQFSSDPEIRGFSGVRNSFEALQRIGQTGTPQSDMALIFQFMRALDPGSVVREAEYSTAQNATSLGGQFQNYINRLTTGEKLNDQQRSEMIDIARRLYVERAQGYNERADRYRTMLAGQGVAANDLDTHIPLVPLQMGGQMGGYIDDTLTDRPLPSNPTGPEPTPAPLVGERQGASSQPARDSRRPDVAVTGMGAPSEEARLYEDRWEATGRNDPRFAGLNGEVRSLFLRNASDADYRRLLSSRGFAPQQIEGALQQIRRADGWAQRNRGRREDVGFDMERELRWREGVDISQSRNPDATGMENVGQRVDSVVRGAGDTLTMGAMDDIAGLLGGEESRDMQRAIDQWDEDFQTGTRIAGQIGGGVLLPFPARGAGSGILSRYGRQMGAGGAYGAAYGVGSSDGDLGERLGNGILMGGIGALGAPIIDQTIGRAGRALGARTAPRSADGVPSRGEAVAAADRLGITGDLMPSTTGGTGTQIAAATSGSTLGAIPLTRGARREVGAISSAVDDTAQRLGRVRDVEGAGLSAQDGVEAGIARRESQQEALFNRVAVQPNADATTTNTQRVLGELTSGFSSNPALGEAFRNPRLEGYLTALQNGRLSWRDLNAFRQRVGEIIGSPTVLKDDTTTGQMRALYGAIREDMRATARNAGPAIERRLERAFGFAEQLHRDREQVFRSILGPRMNASGESAYRAISRMAQREGGDISALRRLFAAIPSEEANTIRATYLSRLGMATPGNGGDAAFSPRTFVTNWSKMSPAAQRTLMGRENAQAIQDLVTVASRANYGQRFTNHSRSAMGLTGTGAVAAVGSGAMSLGTTALAAAGTYLSGALLSSPILTRALARGVRSGTPEGIARQLTRVAGANPGISQDAIGLRDLILRAANDNSVLRMGSQAAASGEPGDDQ